MVISSVFPQEQISIAVNKNRERYFMPIDFGQISGFFVDF